MENSPFFHRLPSLSRSGGARRLLPQGEAKSATAANNITDAGACRCHPPPPQRVRAHYPSGSLNAGRISEDGKALVLRTCSAKHQPEGIVYDQPTVQSTHPLFDKSTPDAHFMGSRSHRYGPPSGHSPVAHHSFPRTIAFLTFTITFRPLTQRTCAYRSKRFEGWSRRDLIIYRNRGLRAL